MKDFRVLKLPLSEDPIENRINELGRILAEDESGDYVVLALESILDYFRSFPYSESVELNRAECRLGECVYWLEQYYSKTDTCEEADGSE